MGRVNYGPYLADRKGIQRVRLGMQLLFGWEVYTLPMENLSQLSFVPEGADGRPGFRKGTFSARTDADCFVDMKGFKKESCSSTASTSAATGAVAHSARFIYQRRF